MTMRGEELVSLLGAYVSGLEDSILAGREATSPGIPPLTSGGAPQSPMEATGLTSLTALSGATNVFHDLLPDLNAIEDTLAAATAGSTFTPGGRLELLDRLPGADRNAANLRGAVGGGLAPTGLSELLTLFRQHSSPAWNNFTLQQYSEQSSTQISEGVSGPEGAIARTDYGSDGLPRAIDQPRTPAPRIDVRIEALDARSFLDRKEDIAEAVRQAMLTSGILGLPLDEY